MNNRRIIVSKFGGAENLRIIEEEIPVPDAHEVRVKILTAGVSLADILICEGIHPESMFKRTPFSLGWDIVGIVDKVGEKVSKTSTWQIGDSVAALPIVGDTLNTYVFLLTSSCRFLPGWTPLMPLA